MRFKFPWSIVVPVLLISFCQPTMGLDPITIATGTATAVGYIFKAGDIAQKIYKTTQEDDQPDLMTIHSSIQDIYKSVSD